MLLMKMSHQLSLCLAVRFSLEAKYKIVGVISNYIYIQGKLRSIRYAMKLLETDHTKLIQSNGNLACTTEIIRINGVSY